MSRENWEMLTDREKKELNITPNDFEELYEEFSQNNSEKDE